MTLTPEQKKKILEQKAGALQAVDPAPIHVNNFVGGIEFGQVEISEKGDGIFRKEASIILTAFYQNKPIHMVEMNVAVAIALKELLEKQIEHAMVEFKTDAPLKIKKAKQDEGTEGLSVR